MAKEEKKDIKFWIKIYTDICEDENIKIFLGRSGGTTVFSAWIILLCLSGRINRGGAFVDKEGVPYSEKDIIALCSPLKEGAARMGFKALLERGMLSFADGCYFITNWDEYNGNRERELVKERVARHRERKRATSPMQSEDGFGEFSETSGEEFCKTLSGSECNVTDTLQGGQCNGKCNVTSGVTSALPSKEKESSKEKETIEFKEFKDIQSITLSGAHADSGFDDPKVENPCFSSEGAEDMGSSEGEPSARTRTHTCTHTHACVHTCEASELDSEASEERVRMQAMRLELMNGKLGGGVVMLSARQFDILCELLSLDEVNKYIGIVRDCELRGHNYKRKSHFKAILDMVERDRQADLDTTYEMIMEGG